MNQSISYYIDKIAFSFILLLTCLASFNKPLTNYAAAIVMVCYLIYPYKSFKDSIKHPLILGCLVWLAWLIITSLSAQNPILAFDNIKGHNWLLYPLFFYPFLANQPRRISKALSVLLTVYLIFLVMTYVNLALWPHEFFRFSSGYLQLYNISKHYPLPANHFNTAIIYMYLVVTAYALFPQTSSKLYKTGLIALGLLALYADMGINTSRMGYVTEATLLLLFFILNWRVKGLISFIVIAIISITMLYNVSSTFHHKINKGFQQTTHYFQAVQQDQHDRLDKIAYTSFGSRLTNLATMSDKMKQASLIRNLVGFGPGHYQPLMKQYVKQLPKDSVYYNIHPKYFGPDNHYFKNWVEIGIVGVALLLLILGYWLYHARFIPLPYKLWAQSGIMIYLISSLCVNPDRAILIRIILLPIMLTYMLYSSPTNKATHHESQQSDYCDSSETGKNT